MNNRILLHGAAMVYNGCTYLFIARTGGGKSTLSLFLHKRGWGYLSDDQIEIDSETLITHGSYKAIDLRKSSMALLSNMKLLRSDEVVIDATPGRERYMYYPPLCSGNEYPLGTVFFLERWGKGNCLSPLSKREAMQMLMLNSIYPVAVSGVFVRSIGRIAERVRGVFRYSDMAYIAQTIERQEAEG